MATWTDGDVLTSDRLNAGLDRVMVKPSASSTTSTTPNGDGAMSAPVRAGGVYLVSLVLGSRGPSAADVRVSWSLPAGSSGQRYSFGPAPAATNPTAADMSVYSASPGNNTTYGLGGITQVAVVDRGIVRVGDVPGTLTVQWSQSTVNASPIYLHQYSYLIVKEVL